MNILLIHQAFVSPKEAGGTRHYEFAQRCLTCGHEITIIASNLSYLDGKRNTESNRIFAMEKISSVNVMRAYTFASIHKSFVWRVISFVSFMITSFVAGLRNTKVDLVMGTSPPIFQAATAWLLAKLKGKPFLLEIRDLWPEFAIDMGVIKNPLLIWPSRLLERFLYTQATQLIVNSPSYKDYLVNKGVAQNKISLIPNGVDPNMFNPDSSGSDFRKAFKIEEKFVVTYAGALGMANDIPTIIKAAKVLEDKKDIFFLIVGDGKDRSLLEKTAKLMKLKNIIFTGPQPKSLMQNVLAASDACIATLLDIPMFKTTYPNKVFDYMAAGRPTILAIGGAIRDVLEAANGGISVPPGDSQALANAVEYLYNNPSVAKQMGVMARQHVLTNFDRNLQAQQFIELIEIFE